jgi:hypothetical protein
MAAQGTLSLGEHKLCSEIRIVNTMISINTRLLIFIERMLCHCLSLCFQLISLFKLPVSKIPIVHCTKLFYGETI